MLGYNVHILEDINWVVSMNVCAIFTAILWESFGFSQARQYFQHEVVHSFMIKCEFNVNGTGVQVVCSDPHSLF